MFTQTLYEAIKRFQSHFPREVVYVEKEVRRAFKKYTEFFRDKNASMKNVF